MSTLMPRGVVRVCAKACGYRAFTLHTEAIPCTTPECDGYLGWPERWPHVCSDGNHEVMLEVRPEPPHVPVTACSDCETEKLAKNSRRNPCR